MILANTSESDISGFTLSIIDDKGNSYTDIWWDEGQSSQTCYPYMLNSKDIPTLNAGQNLDLAFRVLGNLIPTASKLYANLNIGGKIVEDAEWEIVKPSIQSLCQVENWSIIPLKLYVFPYSQGFKHLVIPFAIKNDSSYPGYLLTNEVSNWYVTSEGGFSYPVETWPIWTPEGNEYTTTSTMINSQFYAPSQDLMLPPGFVRYGTSGGTYDEQSNIIFKVAETQRSFTIVIPNLKIGCLHPDGQFYFEDSGVKSFLVEEGKEIAKINFPTNRLDNDFESITNIIEFPDIGKFEYIGIERNTIAPCTTPCLIKMHFKFTNYSQGYEVQAPINGYIIGNDGLLSQRAWLTDGCGLDYYAGPGQTIDLTICFFNGGEVRNLKFIWVFPDKTIHIFNIPDL